jgi:hypothetical protein
MIQSEWRSQKAIRRISEKRSLPVALIIISSTYPGWRLAF